MGISRLLILLTGLGFVGSLAAAEKSYVYGRKTWRVSMQVVYEAGPQERLWAAKDLWRTPDSGMLVLSETNEAANGTGWEFSVVKPWYGYEGRQVFWQHFTLRTVRKEGQWWGQLDSVLLVANPSADIAKRLQSERQAEMLAVAGPYGEIQILREIRREEVEPKPRLWFDQVSGVLAPEAGEGMPAPVTHFDSDGTVRVTEDPSRRSMFPFHFGATYCSHFSGVSFQNLAVYWRVEELPGEHVWKHNRVVAQKPAYALPPIWDDESRTLYLVEGDGQTVSAIRFSETPQADEQPEVLWRINLREALGMHPYRVARSSLTSFSLTDHLLNWRFSNSQFGTLDTRTGQARMLGQD